MAIDLKDLGLTQEQLQERVIESIASNLLTESFFNEDGEGGFTNTAFENRLKKLIRERIDQRIDAMAEKHVLPKVTDIIENLCLQETTKWGEARGKPLTFLEYLVARAEAYMREDVNYDGKTKEEANGYSWAKSQTRITHLVHKHLHYSIETAMKQALQQANSSIVKGIEQTVRMKLEEFSKQLTATVKVGR